MSYLAHVRSALGELDARALRRKIRVHRDDVLDFSSNDYLGLAKDPEMLEALRGAERVGSGGARLLAGAHPEHAELETDLARLVRREDALLFSSGYLAALGAIGALARFATVAYSDEYNHACLIDGLRSTRLPRTIYPHRSLPAATSRTTPGLVVSETIFGMDGDTIDANAFVASLGPDDFAFVDEAHAIGITGPGGGGLLAGFDDPRLIVMGTLSKALGALGGFVAGPATAVEYLRNAARTFIFDTALPPGIAAAARVAVRRIAGGDGGRIRIAELAARLRARLRDGGVAVPDGIGAVVPIVIGDAEATLAIAGKLDALGIHVPAIRPPTVPAGTSRLRVTLRADHTTADVERLADALRTVLGARPATA